MRKPILLVLLSILAMSTKAQDISDALRYSQTGYLGTARSLAMGNAFTALGGDLGSIGINPAGVAVSNFSQYTITPSLSLNSSKTLYNSTGNVDANGTIKTSSHGNASLGIPNFGMVLHFDTGRVSGVKSWSLGIVTDVASSWSANYSAGGNNSTSSYMGYLAALANDKSLTADQLGGSRYYNMSPSVWPAMVGYRSGMISGLGNEATTYVSPAQSTTSPYLLRGTLSQTYGVVNSGQKYDAIINAGINIDDRLYLGANLGTVSIIYNSDSMIGEAAVDSDAFPITLDGNSGNFKSMRFRQVLQARGEGIYAKLGAIYLPTDGLRLGIAFRTPTINYIAERMWYSGTTDFGTFNYSEVISGDEEYYYEYKFISPWRINVGLAYVLGTRGSLSVDYEMADYRKMRFSDKNAHDGGSWDNLNTLIKDEMRMAHELRVGMEIRATSKIALRAGYNLSTNPYKAYSAFKQAFSLGLGYSSEGPFFCDIAMRSTYYPSEYIYPYPTYMEGYDSPEIKLTRNLCEIAATLGWRF